MAYLDIPLPTDQLDDSQNDIRVNFQEIQNLIVQNHFDFGTANFGKHKEVTLPENVAPTLTNVDEANIYSQLSPRTGFTELYWQRENAGPNARQIIEWTGLLAATAGWTRLPSGILLKWGAEVKTGSETVLYPVGATIPIFTNVFTTFISPVSSTAGDNNEYAYLTSLVLDTVSFSVFCGERTTEGTPAQVAFYYLTIGI